MCPKCKVKIFFGSQALFFPLIKNHSSFSLEGKSYLCISDMREEACVVFTQGQCISLNSLGVTMETRHGSEKSWAVNQSATRVEARGRLRWCGLQWAAVDHCLLTGSWGHHLGQHENFSLTHSLLEVRGSQTHRFEIQQILFYRKRRHFFFNYLLKYLCYSLKNTCWW